MSDSIRYSGPTLDAADPHALAAFYVAITGGRTTFSDENYAVIESPGGEIGFQRAPDHVPPIWPDPAASYQIHLDFVVHDLDAAEARVLAAGATKYEFQPGGHCRVFADPAGHPFCLTLQETAGDFDL